MKATLGKSRYSRELKTLNNPDSELEDRIQAAYRHCLRVWNRPAWLELANLIKQRSPRQVVRMEQAKGLR